MNYVHHNVTKETILKQFTSSYIGKLNFEDFFFKFKFFNGLPSSKIIYAKLESSKLFKKNNRKVKKLNWTRTIRKKKQKKKETQHLKMLIKIKGGRKVFTLV